MKNTAKKVTRNEQVNLVDLFYYLIGNWYWFLLAILASLVVAYVRYARMPFVYSSTVTAIIKNPNEDIRTVRMETYDRMINNVSVSNEELQLRSVSLMTEVVKALDADVDYLDRIKVRDVELYTSLSPVRMAFDRENEDPGVFEVTVMPLDAHTIRLHTEEGSKSVALGDTISLGSGRVVFLPTARYNPECYGQLIRVRKYSVATAANRYISRLHITDDEQILHLTEYDLNAQRAADIVNMLVVKYNEAAIREKNRVAVNTERFINERLAIIEQELGSVEGGMAAFKSSNQLMSVDQAASMYLGDSRNYSAELVEIETRLALSGYLKDYVVRSADNFQMIPANMGINDPNVDMMVTQYNDQILRREKLVAASSPESPAVRQADASLNTLRSNILGLIQNLQTSLEIQKRDLSERERAAIQKFSTMPTKERQMLEFERQQSIKQELYLYLLNKREENAISQAMADDNIRVVDPGWANYTPTSPQRMKIIALAILIGLLIPAAILIARLFLDTKIRTRKEIEENIDVPFLAEIPLNKEYKHIIFKSGKHRHGSDRPSPFVYDPNSHSVFTEAMRMMCTNISFLDPDSKLPMVIATTSYSSSSGKTFITANMAACLADAQKRVVLIDTDMRKRSMSSAFDLKHKTLGLSNYLYDLDVTLDDILHKDARPGIDFIPAGPTPPNPTELLARPRLDELINQLRESYDYILLDGVPIQMLADPLVMNRVVDTNLFILRSGQLDRRILPQLDELNEKRHLHNMAIVFNGPQVKRRHGYGFGSYGYGYGYGYGAGYGYYGEDEKKKKGIRKLFG
jgi:capsular exopolysaccharide synthesis family protein